MHLQLHSPVGSASLTFSWPLKNQTSQDVITTMKWILEDLSELKYALEYNVLQAYETDNYESMRNLCARFNKIINIVVQMEKGTSLPSKRINKIPSEGLLSHILDQTYCVSIKNPQVLNKYQVFSPEVYGEVSHELMTNILKKITINSEDIFVDLGSGVGHLVLQLAASSKCKICFGIEKEKIRQDYAEIMSENFKKWMKFYGKIHKPYQLIRGDFLGLENRELIKNSTIIFVNNLSFGPLIDHKLSLIFRELKNGTKIISSKNLCPINMRITERNIHDFGAITHVFEMNDLHGNVSWTNNQIPFYLHVIDKHKLENYLKTKRTEHLAISEILPKIIEAPVQSYKLRQSNAAKKYTDDFEVNRKKATKLKKSTKTSNKENVLLNSKSKQAKRFKEIQMKISLKNQVLMEIHNEQKHRSFLLNKINNLTKNLNNNDMNDTKLQLNKELIEAELNELILKNQVLYKKAKLLQKEIYDLENEYLDINQNCFTLYTNLVKSQLK